ncbi:uncharacterized protein M8220_003613 isoform 1-T1 [Acridotheres tristis]
MGQNWTGRITTLLPSLPRAVVFDQPKPKGFSTRGLSLEGSWCCPCWGKPLALEKDYKRATLWKGPFEISPLMKTPEISPRTRTRLSDDPRGRPSRLLDRDGHPCLQRISSGTHL